NRGGWGWVKRALEWELVVCSGATLLAVCLHVVRLFHAGGLWRDEAGLVRLATLPSLRELWQELTHDSFPLLFPVVLRVWTIIGLGESDFGLRVLGCAIGIGLLGAVWWATWAVARAKPLIALGLLGLNATVIQWGDSIRAYGLGALIMILTLGATWRMVDRPSAARLVAVSILGLLSVQCLYQNAFLLGAILGTAALVCLRHRRFNTALVCLGAGVPAALSLVPYLGPLRESQSWWIVEKTGLRVDWAWTTFSKAVGTPPVLGPAVWIGLFLAAVGFGIAALDKPIKRHGSISSELPLFTGFACLSGASAFILFLWQAGLPTQAWYWLPLMPLVAVCINAALAEYTRRYRRASALAVAAFVALSLPKAWIGATQRMTNVDLVARELSKRVDEADLVVVYPWYCGVSFNRYYAGAAAWLTIPPIADHRFHRYDLVKEKLAARDPLRPALEKIQQVLRAGRRVWIVGNLPEPQPGEFGVPALPPAPHPRWGWFDVPYNYVWGRQLRHFIETGATRIEPVSLPAAPKRVSLFERLATSVASGYQPTTF
ncbi:MAG: hypothetical protein NZ739_02890, partial [Verrucomicrobiae bacterium]|nr:hypothetical protein [Verrucomicrobiae bacterium]